ncbi:unnamed protein product, partial [Brachionus calyciflorus]
MEELIKCDKCSVATSDGLEHNEQVTIAKMAIVKCLDCNLNMCTSCILDHQFNGQYLTHKLLTLIEQSDERKEMDEYTTEINNNVITEKSYMHKADDLIGDSELIRRRQIEDEDKNTTKEQIQLQHMQQIQQYQISNQLIANKLKQQQQQQAAQTSATNAKLVQIENEISKTFNFYVQMLKERKDYLVKELNTIIQFALLNHNQNVNKQLQVQFQLEMKKQQVEKEITDDYDMLNVQGNTSDVMNVENGLKNKLNFLNELNNLILVNNQLILQLKSNNPLMSIEFISNYSAIQTSIRNTFGYIRINPQTQQCLPQTTTTTNSNQNSAMFALNNNNNKNGSMNQNSLTNELSILCDFKSNAQQLQQQQPQIQSGLVSNGSISNQQQQQQLQANLFSNNSTSTNVSSMSSASSTSSSGSSTCNLPNDLITSPISIIMNKQKKTTEQKMYQCQDQNNNDNNEDVDNDENDVPQCKLENGVAQDDVENDEDDTTTLKLNDKQQHQETITLSAGSV